MKSLALILATGAALLSGLSAHAADSVISLYAGGAFMRDYQDSCGDGYYYDCGPYYSSDTYSGPEFGVDARFVVSGGLLFEFTGEQARVSDLGDAYLEQQFTAGLGYQGHIGRRSSWFAEGFYQRYRIGENFQGCDYSCFGWYKANGGGVKGGFTWPFSDRWYGTLAMRVSYLSGDQDDLVQAKFDGSVGFMLNPNLSLGIGVSSQAQEQTRNNGSYYYNGYYYDYGNDELSHTAVYLKLSAHF